MTEPYQNLANAIILMAVKDYRTALKKLKNASKVWTCTRFEKRGGEVLPL